jgi:hypothetical protein
MYLYLLDVLIECLNDVVTVTPLPFVVTVSLTAHATLLVNSADGAQQSGKNDL